jgi:hypothetical protein
MPQTMTMQMATGHKAAGQQPTLQGVSWLDRVIEDPMRAFATPAQVLRDERLDAVGMRAVLEAWERGARRLAASADEGMAAGAESTGLREVRAALRELDRRVMASSEV